VRQFNLIPEPDKGKIGRYLYIILAAITLGVLGGLTLFYYIGYATQTLHPLGAQENTPEPVYHATVASDKSPDPSDMYKLFLCPCCGSTIDADCCELAVERKAYLDGLLDGGLDKTNTILKMVSRYGINSLANDSLKSEIRGILAERAPKDRPQIVIYPESYDLGNVSASRGVVTTTVHVENRGRTDLIINDIITSCGCTTAAFILGEEESPRFGIRGQIEGRGWSIALKPGEVALLRVYYDPKMHSDIRGHITRLVTIYSNDPIDPEVTFKLHLTQVD
jgi:hypothetical protein